MMNSNNLIDISSDDNVAATTAGSSGKPVTIDSHQRTGYFNAAAAAAASAANSKVTLANFTPSSAFNNNSSITPNNSNNNLLPKVNIKSDVDSSGSDENNKTSFKLTTSGQQGVTASGHRVTTTGQQLTAIGRQADESAIWGDVSMDIMTTHNASSSSPDSIHYINQSNQYNQHYHPSNGRIVYQNFQDRVSLNDIQLNSGGCHSRTKSLKASMLRHSAILYPSTCFNAERCCSWASIKMFCFLACLLIMVHGMLATGYTFSVLTTIEKRFTVNSVISGFIISSYEVGSLMSVVFVSYFGTHGHIPRWIGMGGIPLCLGSFLFSFPHFIAPAYEPPNVNDSGPGVCTVSGTGDHTPFSSGSGSSSIIKQEIDRSTAIINPQDSTFITGYVYILIFAQILLGAGGSPIFTLGTSYIDNHVDKDNASMYLAFMYVMMAVGPVLGFLLGALLLGEYVDPFKVPPKMESTSPYWIGLWWGGYIICGCLYIVTAFPFFLFPRRLSTSKELSDKESEYGRSWSKIPVSVARLLSNSVYMIASLSACVELAIVSGFTTFLPKYIETQFNLSPSSASGLTGLVAIPGACVGIFFGGWIIKHLKLEMKGVANYVLIVNCVSMAMLTLFFAFGCQNLDIAGLTAHYDSKTSYDQPMNLSSACNLNCGCLTSKYSPVCGSNNVTYVSPCHAGCTTSVATGKQRTNIVGDVTWDTHNYTGCSCLSTNSSVPATLLTAKEGICASDCKMLAPFLILLFLISLAASNNQMPLVLVTLRSVSEEEKAFALGVQLVLLRLFGYIPSPMLYGAVIDSSCMLPSDSFARRDQASCLMYDVRKFRIRFSWLSLALMVVAFILSLLLWYSVRKRYTPFSPPVTMSEIVHRLGDIENLHIRRSTTAGSLRSWVSDDSLYSRPRSPRHQKTRSC